MPVFFKSRSQNIQQAVEAMKLGAFDFLEKPFSLSFLRIKLEKIQSHLSLKTQNGILREELESKKWTLVGHHTRIQEVREQITRYSKVDSPVLILGESGTGKEIAARMIVNQSSRRYEPFIVVNCGAIPMDLMESMFFGHEKGSFTGAHALQKGKFELARGGTIFLDEIGELPWALQAKLLRIIETGEFERIGGKQTLKTDARIISATNRNLENLVKKDVFRLDLYYRLNVLVLEMPSLCERLEDLPTPWLLSFKHNLSNFHLLQTILESGAFHSQIMGGQSMISLRLFESYKDHFLFSFLNFLFKTYLPDFSRVFKGRFFP